jgi:alkaline phosphatase
MRITNLKRSLRPLTCALLATAVLSGAAAAQERGNVIFFHPDGTGLNHWNALRTLDKGPDGELNWDKLPGMAIYAGHMKDALTGTSNGGATVHAYGVKVGAASFGMDNGVEITAASGKKASIAMEARDAGRAVGLIQTGHIGEPGTAAFVAQVKARSDVDTIADQVIRFGAQVIMAGGERFLLPETVDGRFGKGSRKDGRNLIEEAKRAGYTVVYTREELKALDVSRTDKLLGVFARGHTFNDQTEEKNREENKPHYVATAPTIAEMAEVAIAILSRDPDGFFLVAEEEGTDNMGNRNNAPGQFEALRRADAAVGVFSRYIAQNPNTTLLMAADSDAGAMQILGPSLRRASRSRPASRFPKKTQMAPRSTESPVRVRCRSPLRRTRPARPGHSQCRGAPRMTCRALSSFGPTA